MKLKSLYITVSVSLCIGLLAGCESDEGEDGFNPENRRITEISGVEYYDGYKGEHYSRHCRHQFFYDDEGRLDRWTNTEGSYSHDLEFYYESDSRISIFGTKTNSPTGETSVCYEVELDAAGRVIQIRDGDDSSTSYTYSGGMLTGKQQYYTPDPIFGTEHVDTSRYVWANGDLTQIDFQRNSSFYYHEFFQIEYGTVPNIANLDLNYLVDYMDSTSDPERMLRIAGMLGRNAHFATRDVTKYGSISESESSENYVIVDIEWSFDEAGYPTGWKSLARDLGASEKDTGWEYTIYYE